MEICENLDDYVFYFLHENTLILAQKLVFLNSCLAKIFINPLPIWANRSLEDDMWILLASSKEIENTVYLIPCLKYEYSCICFRQTSWVILCQVSFFQLRIVYILSIYDFIKGSFNNYVTQNYKILTYLPIFVTLFYDIISFYR